MIRLICPLALLALTTAAAAQPAAGDKSDAILRELRAINGRLDRMDKRIDRIEGGKPSDSVTPSPPPRAAATQSKGRGVAGWYVWLHPWTEDRNADAVAGFAGPNFDFNFDMHSQIINDQNRYIYRGISFYHPKEDAEYTFAITLEPVAMRIPSATYLRAYNNCSAELQINGNRVVAGTTKYDYIEVPEGKEIFRAQTFYGQYRLTPEVGKIYRLELRTDCWLEGQGQRDATSYDRVLPVWKKNRFRIMVRGPADTVPRPPQPDELWYVGQPS